MIGIILAALLAGGHDPVCEPMSDATYKMVLCERACMKTFDTCSAVCNEYADDINKCLLPECKRRCDVDAMVCTARCDSTK